MLREFDELVASIPHAVWGGTDFNYMKKRRELATPELGKYAWNNPREDLWKLRKWVILLEQPH